MPGASDGRGGAALTAVACTASRSPPAQVFVEHRERSASFTFDGVFGPAASQADVYAVVAAPLVSDVLDGYEGAILAYGQTGSGKTHSLLAMGAGGDEEAGLFPRLAADVFAAVEADFRNACTVEVAFFQIYNEQVDDLLRPAGVNLKVRSEGEGGPAHVEGLHFAVVSSAASLLEVFRAGRRRLVYAETVMNMHSSRSHAVLQLRVTKTSRPAGGEGDGDGGAVAVRQLVGRLWVVDLAGSERVKKSAAEGQRLKEATNINTSLLAMGNCVAALAQRAKHVPYRDSNLTRLLEPALCGRSRTALLVCVAPEEEHASEGVGALEFAVRAMRIATAPTQNAATLLLSPAQLAEALGRGATDSALAEHGREILRLEGALGRAGAAHDRLSSDVAQLRLRVAQEAEAAEAMRRRADRAEAEWRQAQAAREFFAAAAADSDAARAEEAAVAAALLAESEAASAAAAAGAAAREAHLAGQLEEQQRATASAAAEAAEARSAAAAAAAEAAAARAVAASTADAIEASWRAATAAHAAYADQLRSDVAAAAAACTAQTLAAASARGEVEAALDAFLAIGVSLPKMGRNGKRYDRIVRWSRNRLEWAAKGAGPWKGVDTTGAVFDGGERDAVVSAPHRSVVLLLESGDARAWAAALRARLAPPPAAPPSPPPKRGAGAPPPPPQLPAMEALMAAGRRSGGGAASLARAASIDVDAGDAFRAAIAAGMEEPPPCEPDADDSEAQLYEAAEERMQQALALTYEAHGAGEAREADAAPAHSGSILSPSAAAAATSHPFPAMQPASQGSSPRLNGGEQTHL